MFVKSIQQVSLNRLFRSMLAASATGIAFVPGIGTILCASTGDVANV